MNNSMKVINKILLVTALTLGLACNTAIAKDYTIAISPYIGQVNAKAQAISVMQFMTSLEAGDEIILLDGFNLKTIGTFIIPENPLYNSSKARLGFNRQTVGSLMKFAKSSHMPNGDNQPSVTGALRLPQLLRYISNNMMGETEIIILGSPLYDDPLEPSFSMAKGIYPSDGHLKHGRDKTPFGIAGNVDALKGMRIHMAYGDEYKTISDQRDFQINRFWTLYIEVQGGELISFVGDLKTLFKNVKRSMNAPKHDYKLNDSDKLEMIRLRTETIKQSIHTRPISQIPLTNRQLQRAVDIEIGISWDCPHCDLDLFARAFPTAETLYFNHTNSPEGSYWKDHVKSPRATNGYETIAFRVPLDLRALRLAINFYNGKAPNGVTGQIRLSVDGRTYGMNFTIPATSGNQGRGIKQAIASGVSNDPHSLIIDPLRIVALQ